MLQRAFASLQKLARPRAIGMVLLAFLLFALGVMQPGAGKLQELSGKPVEVLDLQFGFSVEEARSILSAYSPAARTEAAAFLVWADTLYPLIYGMLLALLLAYLFPKGRGQYLVIFPVLAVIVDFAENYWLHKILTSFPNEEYSWIRNASFCNAGKWSLLGLTGLFLLGASIHRLTQFLPSVRKGAP